MDSPESRFSRRCSAATSILSTSYQQFSRRQLGQHVGELWMLSGPRGPIPYRGLLGLQYAGMAAWTHVIL